MITDINKDYDKEVITKLRAIDNTIKFRMLYWRVNPKDEFSGCGLKLYEITVYKIKKPTGFGEVFLNPIKDKFWAAINRNLLLLSCFLGEVRQLADEAWFWVKALLGIV